MGSGGAGSKEGSLTGTEPDGTTVGTGDEADMGVTTGDADADDGVVGSVVVAAGGDGEGGTVATSLVS